MTLRGYIVRKDGPADESRNSQGEWTDGGSSSGTSAGRAILDRAGRGAARGAALGALAGAASQSGTITGAAKGALAGAAIFAARRLLAARKFGRTAMVGAGVEGALEGAWRGAPIGAASGLIFGKRADGASTARDSEPIDSTALDGVVAKYSPDQARDDHGRWTSGGSEEDAQAVHDALDAPAAVKGAAANLVRNGLATLHQHAAGLAAKARRIVSSTRLHDLRPTPNGGVELSATHELPGSAGHILSQLQIAPFMLGDNPRAHAALGAIHAALRLHRPMTADIMPPLRVSFRNGRAQDAKRA